MSAGSRLMWKEYRVLRGFWLALATFGLACDGLILFVANAEDRLVGLFSLAGVLPACFALGAGATLFALEREESTRELLQYLPLTSLRIFASKIGVALSGTVLITLVLLSVGLSGFFGESAGDGLSREDSLAGGVQIAAAYALMVLQALGWSVFFSLRSARPLLAAILGAVSALACVGLVQFVVLRLGGSEPQRSFIGPLAHGAMTAVLWLIDVRLGSTWLHGRRAAVSPRIERTSRQLSLTRPLWQQWRSSRRMLAVLALLGLILPLLQWTDPYSGGLGAVPAVGLVLALFGSCTFLADQERSQFRFFAERGVPGRSLWFSRLLFWAGSASVLAMILLVAHLFMVRLGIPNSLVKSPSWRRAQFVLSWFPVEIGPSRGTAGAWASRWLTELSGYIVWLGLSFGAGQLCSMFFRSGLLAAVFGVMLAGILLAWAALMDVLSIGWWWAVAPLAVALVAATRLRAEGWLVERRSVRAWLPAVLAFAVPAVVILTAVPIYRVLEIPKVDIEGLQLGAQPPASAEANDAVRRLRDTFGQLSQNRTKSFPTFTDECPPEERAWLTENQFILDALVETLSQLPPDATAGRTTRNTAATWQQMATSIIWYGQIAEGDGKLDEAWTRYRAALELAHVVRRQTTALGEALGDAFERTALSQLLRWGAREGQTEERLRAGVAALKQLEGRDEPLADLVRCEYQANLAHLNEIEAQSPHGDVFYGFAAKWAPWEFARVRRLLGYVASKDLKAARSADTAGTEASAPWIHSDLTQANLLWQTTLLAQPIPIDAVIEARRWTLCYRRATQLGLAAEGWRLEHGEMPEKLEELEKDFGPLPSDPYTKQPFLWFPWGLRLAARSKNVTEIPAKTPLLYSVAKAWPDWTEPEHLEELRRESADEPNVSVSELLQRKGGGSSVGFQGRFVPRPSANTPPTAVAVDSSLVHLGGLAFPIPNREDESAKVP